MPGTKIKAAPVNNVLADLAEALTGSLPRDGSVPVAGDLDVEGQVAARGVRSSGQVRGEGANAFRAVFGGRGVILRNDGRACYLMQTAEGDPDGPWDTHRPFAWDFATGSVAIDGTGRGANFGGPVTIGGAASVDGALTCGPGGSFAANTSPLGFQMLPGGVCVQWGGGTTNQYGGLSFAWPTAFRTALRGFAAIAGWNAPRAVVATQGVSDRFGGTVWLTYGEGTPATGVAFSYLAVGI